MNRECKSLKIISDCLIGILKVKALDALEAKSVPREGDKALTADKNISMSTEYVEPGVSEETKPVIRGAVKRMTPAQVKYCTPEKNMKMTQIMVC